MAERTSQLFAFHSIKGKQGCSVCFINARKISRVLLCLFILKMQFNLCLLLTSFAFSTKVTNLGTRGTKDRRAVTAQRVSLYRYTAERVKEINARLRGIRLSDFTYEEKPCILGDLWGNRFQIALR